MVAMAQRSPFAGGIRGSGYKDGLLQQTPPSNNNNNNNFNNDNSFIGNRNGDGSIPTGFQQPSYDINSNLPIDARGDAYLVNHYNTLPVDHRPFWLLNADHIEAQRGTPPKRPPTSSSTNQFNALDFPTRFGQDGADFGAGGFNNYNRPTGSSNNNQNNAAQPGIVYPVGTTPDQQIAMEIQFLQQRLNSLQQQRNQNQF